jgi:TonB family protein
MSRRSQVESLTLFGQSEPAAIPFHPLDLLGQREPYPIAVFLPGKGEPRLSIAWNSFHQNFFSELVAFFQWTRVPKIDPADDIFNDCRIRRSIPARAIVAALLWHVVFFVAPWPSLPGAAKRNPAFDNTELTWSGPIDDLPLLNVPKQAPKAAHPQTQPADASNDAFHPRQRIYTDPSHSTHPRQTLVRPSAPADAPNFVAALPNIVQLAGTAGPVRPRLEISEQTLAKLRPKQVKHKATTGTPWADAPNLETHPSDMNLAALATPTERPKLELNAGATPRLAQQGNPGDTVAAPEVAAGSSAATETIIALSSAPAPPAPVVEVPKGNLSSHVAMSPEGKGTGSGGGNGSGAGTPGGAPGGESDAAKSSIGISISGGNPKPNAGVASSGGAGKLVLPKASTGYKRPDPNSAIDDPPERTGPPNFATFAPGTKPEEIFATHRVYSMNVNMPNVNSVTGSWIIHFAELHKPGPTLPSGELNAPVPVRKVDPKYPQSAIAEHIQGEVILYGVIRQDGSVDSIQLVRGIDKQLDANAVAAFAQWKFQPASKSGEPVALEAIVHIPFRGPEPE